MRRRDATGCACGCFSTLRRSQLRGFPSKLQQLLNRTLSGTLLLQPAEVPALAMFYRKYLSERDKVLPALKVGIPQMWAVNETRLNPENTHAWGGVTICSFWGLVRNCMDLTSRLHWI